MQHVPSTTPTFTPMTAKVPIPYAPAKPSRTGGTITTEDVACAQALLAITPTAAMYEGASNAAGCPPVAKNLIRSFKVVRRLIQQFYAVQDLHGY